MNQRCKIRIESKVSHRCILLSAFELLYWVPRRIWLAILTNIETKQTAHLLPRCTCSHVGYGGFHSSFRFSLLILWRILVATHQMNETSHSFGEHIDLTYILGFVHASLKA